MSPYKGSFGPFARSAVVVPVQRNENSGIDVDFSRNAPKGKFRVVSVDTFDGTDGVDGDFDTLGLAEAYIARATEGQEMLKMHIYDDKGDHVGEGGSY
ncbi:TPA: hypothetical protein DIS55_01800 [Candidatus Kaiserbacteria bacterium]|nr:hypothetical protein [Candidatus Kaiserbacteria bacterium]